MARLKKQNIPFTQIANEVLSDQKLSWKAKGLFAYLFSKPDGWNFESIRISNDSSDGRDSTRRAIKELEENGYLMRVKLNNRRMAYELKYNEKPMTENPSLTMTEKANDGKPHSGKTRHISNKEEFSNKEEHISKKEISIAKSSDFADKVNPLIELFKEVNPNYTELYRNKTQRQAILWLVEKYGLEKIESVIKALPKIIFRKYAPTITTPVQLKNKLGDLVVFMKKEKGNSPVAPAFNETNKTT